MHEVLRTTGVPQRNHHVALNALRARWHYGGGTAFNLAGPVGHGLGHTIHAKRKERGLHAAATHTQRSPVFPGLFMGFEIQSAHMIKRAGYLGAKFVTEIAILLELVHPVSLAQHAGHETVATSIDDTAGAGEFVLGGRFQQ